MSSELLNPPFLVQNAGGKTGIKMLPCISLARPGILMFTRSIECLDVIQFLTTAPTSNLIAYTLVSDELRKKMS